MSSTAARTGRLSASGGSTLRLGLARTVIELKQFSRERDSVVFSFLFPVILLAIFGAVFNDEIAPGVSFTQYFAAGMIASGIMLSSFQALSIGIALSATTAR